MGGKEALTPALPRAGALRGCTGSRPRVCPSRAEAEPRMRVSAAAGGLSPSRSPFVVQRGRGRLRRDLRSEPHGREVNSLRWNS